MKDNDDNLEKFLRDKFAEDNTSSDGWDVPNPKIWEEAQLHIPNYPIQEKKDRKGIVIILLLLLIGAYISWSLLRINQLEKELNTQENLFAKIEKENNITNEKHLLDNEILIQENNNLNNKNKELEVQLNNYNNTNDRIDLVEKKYNIVNKKKELFITENNDLQNRLALQSAEISSLKNQNDRLNRQLNHKNIIYANQAIKNNTTPQREKRLSHVNIAKLSPYKTWIETNNNTQQRLNINQITIPQTTQNKRFEIGYSYALTSVNTGYKKDFKDFEIASDGYEKNKALIHSHGINLGFSPKGNNWFIQTGFNTAFAKISQHTKSSIIYDESNEYNNIEGSKVNDIEVNARTLFGENKSLVSVKIPENSNIETGDILYFDTEESQQQQRYNIPLGVAYFHGKRKLKWLVKGGVEWNRIVSKNYTINADVYSSEGIFPIDNIEISKDGSSSSQFIGTYAGLGADYQISSRWHARAEMAYHYNFINKSTEFSTSDLITRDFRLGLNYRF